MTKIYFEILNKEICANIKKPTPATMGAADWWKSMPKYNYSIESDLAKNSPHRVFSTARSCPALNDAFNFGYILYNPVDVYVDATQEDRISWYVPDIDLSIMGLDGQNYIGSHSEKSMEGFKNDSLFHQHPLKLNTFFGIKTENGYSTWITHPIGRNDLPFKMMDAVVDTDKFAAKFPYALFIKKGFKGVIKSGTPLIQIIPFKRDSFVSEIIESNPEETKRDIVGLMSHFTNGYKKLFWSRKKFI